MSRPASKFRVVINHVSTGNEVLIFTFSRFSLFIQLIEKVNVESISNLSRSR